MICPWLYFLSNTGFGGLDRDGKVGESWENKKHLRWRRFFGDE
jgi:hypothetical protein